MPCCRNCRKSIAKTPIRAFMRLPNGFSGRGGEEAWLKYR